MLRQINRRLRAGLSLPNKGISVPEEVREIVSLNCSRFSSYPFRTAWTQCGLEPISVQFPPCPPQIVRGADLFSTVKSIVVGLSNLFLAHIVTADVCKIRRGDIQKGHGGIFCPKAASMPVGMQFGS